MTQQPGGIPAIDVADASAQLEAADPSGPLLIDVREKDEYRTVRANGAVLVPMSEFQDRAAELPKDRPIYVICASGNRSAAVTGFLLRSGWTDVTNVTGGTGEWERRGLPVNRGEPAPGEGEL
ncbi:MAG TPA: rhodanese-like domain-containing protein [Candidatus Limnocylindrales bacterium]|nr:rhodanese-like domain-containing protein [Candidatus Limnocylindrales bacterium]